MFDSIIRLITRDDEDPKPNKFTTAMGELIREAREEANLSQEHLARLISRRRASISDIENGKMEVSATTLMLLAFALKKPLSYFFPEPYKPKLPREDFSEEEQELLFHTRRLATSDMKKVIAQVKAIGDTLDQEAIVENRRYQRENKRQRTELRETGKIQNKTRSDFNSDEDFKLYLEVRQDIVRELQRKKEREAQQQEKKG